MGISKSLKGLFMKKKSKTDIDNSSTDSGIKSPKTKPKRRVSLAFCRQLKGVNLDEYTAFGLDV